MKEEKRTESLEEKIIEYEKEDKNKDESIKESIEDNNEKTENEDKDKEENDDL